MSRVEMATCCTPGAAVELQVLLDLRLALALGGLVDRELELPAAVGHDLRHQRGVLGGDRLVGEVDQLGHAEDALVVAHPLLHVAELDVPDHVVDAREQRLRGRVVARLEAGHERAVVAAALHEQVDRLPVGGDRGELHAAVLVLDPVRRGHAAGAVRHGVRVGGRGVGDAQRDLVDAVAVTALVVADLVLARERARDHEPDASLLAARARPGRGGRSRVPCTRSR